MVTVIIFVSGYAIGGVSALLLVGLALVGRRSRLGQNKLVSYEIEHSAI
ncbi:MAG TPA: hypothetical protein PLO33_02360 [Kouleothrix sp.]|nr:hypothetical protein [Kouleothrix sp.]HRC74489.1 hypothetical protein [Kouleothrix sp.]